jgi:hypothetical protein
MTRGYRMRAVVVAALVCGAGAIAASAGLAAQAPKWKLTTFGNPTNLQPDSPRSETQRIVIDATGGTFTLSFATPITEAGRRFTTTPMPFNATASEVAAKLSELGSIRSAGTLDVVGEGPGATAPYRVTFEGGLGDRPNELLGADGSALTGATKSATVTRVQAGAFPAELVVVATNIGGASTDGSAIRLEDALPPGVTASEVSGYDTYGSGAAFGGFGLDPLSCTLASVVSCTWEAPVMSGDSLVVTIPVTVSANAPGSVKSQLSVSGGGAATVSREAPTNVGETPAAFGPVPGSVFAAAGSDAAGGHPDVTSAFAMDTSEKGIVAGDPKDIRFDLPPGLVGSAVGMPRCTMNSVERQVEEATACPGDTMVGMATLWLFLGRRAGEAPRMYLTPVFNIEPAPGEPVAFAFDAVVLPVRLDTSVLSNGDYGVRVTAPNLSEAAGIQATSITIWGVPADHNGPGSGQSFYTLVSGAQTFGGPSPGSVRTPLLTNPQQCSSPLSATMETDEWGSAGKFLSSEALPMGTLSGCELVGFEPSFSMLPDTLEAGAPAGYNFSLSVPQRNEPQLPASSTVENVSLKLPVGTVINPSAAWGLRACSNEQFYGPDHPSEEPATLGNCPREAQVGTVRVKTPALEEALEGQVYLATPECDPCTASDAESGKMVRLFAQFVSEGEGGIVIKLEGRGHIDSRTGQITTVFENNPQLPFSEFRLKLTGGPRAALANPRSCGPASSDLDLTPWSSPTIPDVERSSVFDVSENCFSPSFAPSFVAGMPNIQAGEFGEFTLAFGRSDDDEYLGKISMRTPPGLLGKLAGVELCKEPQANAGTCGAGSLIGSTAVLTGPGADPFLVEGGRVYLTEGYGGAPFGLSIVVPAVAGPYTLAGLDGRGDPSGSGTVVVRSQIFIDPHSAQLTVVSGSLPSMLDGIPLQLRAVNVRIDRPGFTFNPTNCNKMAVSGTLTSVEGASATVVDPYQVTNCASLAFKPKFAVTSTGKTSRADGASLSVKLSFPSAPQGSEANIHSVKVELPKLLPSRLTTLQKACPAAQFEANPASCPSASIVGHAAAITPLLPVPVQGPAYFVSHGGEAFPSLVLLLQGYGVTIELVGTTFISKTGITSSTFKSVPDVPVSSFELTLPEGKYSALAANGNLCVQTLKMPTEFIAQNGAQTHQTTKINVTGCPKAHKVKHKAKKAKHKAKKAKRRAKRRS